MELILQVEQGNPILITREQVMSERAAIEAAMRRFNVGFVVLHIEKLEIRCCGCRKTLAYPANATVSWVISQITKHAKTVEAGVSPLDKSARNFIALCEHALSNGGSVEIVNKMHLKFRNREIEHVCIYLEKENGHVFRAQCETSILGASGVEHLRALIEKEKLERARKAEEIKAEQLRREETQRLRELARKHGLI